MQPGVCVVLSACGCVCMCMCMCVLEEIRICTSNTQATHTHRQSLTASDPTSDRYYVFRVCHITAISFYITTTHITSFILVILRKKHKNSFVRVYVSACECMRVCAYAYVGGPLFHGIYTHTM